MRIKCPYCGERGNEEFTYLGDANVVRPDGQIPETADSPAWSAWMDYVYLRDNPMGVHRELWYHGAGCHAWLIVTRDVRNHAISAVEPARDAALARRGAGAGR
jgi:heterotetrameric sarcosine oxidase delta subunit